jgi:hypothetical protein
MEVVSMSGGTSIYIPHSVILANREHGFFGGLLASYQSGIRRVACAFPHDTLLIFVNMCRRPSNGERLPPVLEDIESLLTLIISGLPRPGSAPTAESPMGGSETSPTHTTPGGASAAPAVAASGSGSGTETGKGTGTGTAAKTGAATDEPVSFSEEALEPAKGDSQCIANLKMMAKCVLEYWKTVSRLPEEIDILLEPLWPRLAQLVASVGGHPALRGVLEFLMGSPQALAGLDPGAQFEIIRRFTCQALATRAARYCVKLFLIDRLGLVGSSENMAILDALDQATGQLPGFIALFASRVDDMMNVAMAGAARAATAAQGFVAHGPGMAFAGPLVEMPGVSTASASDTHGSREHEFVTGASSPSTHVMEMPALASAPATASIHVPLAGPPT